MSDSPEQSTPPAARPGDELWTQLDGFLARIEAPITLHLWADETASWMERQAVALAREVADRYNAVTCRVFPRRVNYHNYPVIAAKGAAEGDDLDTAVDYGIRLIGLPAGLQITALVGAIQAAAFRGQQLEPSTRIRLHRLPVDVDIRLFTDANDHGGAMLSGMLFSLAAASPRIRTFLLMADQFPTLAVRQGVRHLPHLIFNDGVTLSGVADEEGILRQIGYAVRRAQDEAKNEED